MIETASNFDKTGLKENTPTGIFVVDRILDACHARLGAQGSVTRFQRFQRFVPIALFPQAKKKLTGRVRSCAQVEANVQPEGSLWKGHHNYRAWVLRGGCG